MSRQSRPLLDQNVRRADVCPGSLAEQWQDELYRRFHLPFDILTNDKLSDGEAQLYREVTNYVRDEFNRAEALQNDKRAGTVGFALTVLQRRLASSPEAIEQSLHRRRERLEKRLRELELLQRGAGALAIGGNLTTTQFPGTHRVDFL